MTRILLAPVLIALLFGMSPKALAIMAYPHPLTFTQPDGSQLSVIIHGDERFHYITTADDGLPLVEEDATLYYVKHLSDGTLRRSPMAATPRSLRTAEARTFVADLDPELTIGSLRRRATLAKSRTEAETPRYGLFPGATFPTSGKQKSLVILVEFSDKEFSTPEPQKRFTEMLNQRGYDTGNATGSARDYFISCSDSIFLPDFDVYGPVKLPNDVKYYGENDHSGNDMRPFEMVIDACNALNDTIDFNVYDRDSDGVIDNVFIFYAGGGEATGAGGNTVWPHSSKISDWLYDEQIIYDGVRLQGYACTNEWVRDATCGIGTFCHEFSHVLGLPDLYQTGGVGGVFTPGSWSIMDQGSYNNHELTPAGYSIFERNALKWANPIEITAESDSITLTHGDHGAIIHTSKDTEFFLLENRQQTGWDTYIPGHGMLVWHIDFDENEWINNSPNNNRTHQRVDIEEADNRRSELTRSGDSYPGTSNVTEISDDTYPSLRPWDMSRLNIMLTDITETPDGLIKLIAAPNFKSQIAPPVESDLTNRLSINNGRTAIITLPEPGKISVTTIQGSLIYSEVSTEATILLPTSGIYIITAGVNTSKIIVK